MEEGKISSSLNRNNPGRTRRTGIISTNLKQYLATSYAKHYGNVIAIRLVVYGGAIVRTSSMLAAQSRTYYGRDKTPRLRRIYLIENAACDPTIMFRAEARRALIHC